MPMLKIWGRVNSINVQKVLWCATELDIRYERVDAGGAFGVVRTPDNLALNPNALVPTIEDDGFVLWESNVIVRYLAMKHGMGGLCPSDITDRFESEKWMDWQATTLWPAFRPAFMGLVRTPPEERDASAIARSQEETRKALQALETRLGETRYVAGDTLTMGDIPVGASAYRFFALGFEKAAFPNVWRWYQELTERPGYKTFVMPPLH
jgi:glutathione S-transferase